MVKEDHPSAVNDFAKEILDLWVPFFNATLIGPFPETDDPTFDGVVTLRVQIIRTIMQIRKVFGSLLAPFLGQIFGATWQELDTVKDRYVRDFVINESEGKLVDLDGLPYSLDLLVLEQLDFIQTCLKNKSVRDELARASGGGGPGTPLDQMVHATVALSQVASEDEGMWEVDLNVFLCEETSISANYTPRSASGDLILVRLLVHIVPGAGLISIETWRIVPTTDRSLVMGIYTTNLQVWREPPAQRSGSVHLGRIVERVR